MIKIRDKWRRVIYEPLNKVILRSREESSIIMVFRKVKGTPPSPFCFLYDLLLITIYYFFEIYENFIYLNIDFVF